MSAPVRRPHVMVVAFAAQGHLNPMLQFATRLAAKGVDVTLASTHDARQRMLSARRNHQATSMTAAAGHDQARVEIESFSDGLEPGADRPTDIKVYMDQIEAAGKPSLAELILDLARRGRPVSCLVNNPFVPWVIDVGSQLDIPCAVLWIQSCALYAMYYRYYFEPTLFEQTGSDLNIPSLPPTRFEDLPSLMRPDNPYPIFTRLLGDQFHKMKSLKWVFANSVAEFEPETIESMAELMPVKPVGPLVPFALLDQSDKSNIRADMWAAAPDCLEWLDAQPDNSVIYVSIGSFATLPAEQMAELAWGLKNSKTRFLWVAKPALKESDVGLPEGFVEETSDQGRVVSWCPQTDVLRHRAVAGFLTHCGWNSTLETMSAGVPVIAYPQWTDQPTNAKFLVDVYRVGVRLQVSPHGLVPREEVQRCIEELISGDTAAELRQNALKWKSVLRTAAADGGSSERNIQEFVDELISLCPQSESV